MRRWPHVVGLLFAIVFVVATSIGMAHFVPEKLRDAALKIKNDANLVAQLLPATLPAPSKIDSAYWLPQNWSARQRYWFHHTSQGTATIPVPYRWFLALERPELSVRYTSLTDNEYLRRLGFIPSPSPRTLTVAHLRTATRRMPRALAPLGQRACLTMQMACLWGSRS